MHDDGTVTATEQTRGERTPAAARHRLAWLARPSGRTLSYGLLVILFVVATVLRLDALTGRFGHVTRPAWLQLLQSGSQTLVGVLDPAVANWAPEPEYPHRDGPPTHYRSDPYTYLQRAREMSSFYEAHYREPVFPFVVKCYLWMLGDQDVAVSFASATFSVLCVLATYLMGALAFSRWVGCAAALGMAVEREVISWVLPAGVMMRSRLPWRSRSAPCSTIGGRRRSGAPWRLGRLRRWPASRASSPCRSWRPVSSSCCCGRLARGASGCAAS